MSNVKNSIKIESQALSSNSIAVNKIVRTTAAAIPTSMEAYKNEMDEEFNACENDYAAVAVSDTNYEETGEEDFGYGMLTQCCL